MWMEIIPDTIYISEDKNSLMMAEICQNYIMDEKYKAHKGFFIYKKNNNTFESNDYFKRYGENCDSIYYPKDTLSKYQLFNFAVKVENSPTIKIISKVKKCTKLKTLIPRSNYEFSLEHRVYKNDSLMYYFNTRELSSTKKEMNKKHSYLALGNQHIKTVKLL